jgi:hypothetical protein
MANVMQLNNEYMSDPIHKTAPLFYQGVSSIFENTQHSNTDIKMLLRDFQLTLEKVPTWNDVMLEKEYERFIESTKCDWLDTLIAATFKSSAHVMLSTIGHNVAVPESMDLEIPSGKRFMHNCYINICRKLWKKPQLMYGKFVKSELIQNKDEVMGIISESIRDTIRCNLPIKEVVSSYVRNNDLETGSLNTNKTIGKISTNSFDNELVNEIVDELIQDGYDDEPSDDNEDEDDDEEGAGDDEVVDDYNGVDKDEVLELAENDCKVVDDAVVDEAENDRKVVDDAVVDEAVNDRKVVEDADDSIDGNKEEVFDRNLHTDTHGDPPKMGERATDIDIPGGSIDNQLPIENVSTNENTLTKVINITHGNDKKPTHINDINNGNVKSKVDYVKNTNANTNTNTNSNTNSNTNANVDIDGRTTHQTEIGSIVEMGISKMTKQDTKQVLGDDMGDGVGDENDTDNDTDTDTNTDTESDAYDDIGDGLALKEEIVNEKNYRNDSSHSTINTHSSTNSKSNLKHTMEGGRQIASTMRPPSKETNEKIDMDAINNSVKHVYIHEKKRRNEKKIKDILGVNMDYEHFKNNRKNMLKHLLIKTNPDLLATAS